MSWTEIVLSGYVIIIDRKQRQNFERNTQHSLICRAGMYERWLDLYDSQLDKCCHFLRFYLGMHFLVHCSIFFTGISMQESGAGEQQQILHTYRSHHRHRYFERNFEAVGRCRAGMDSIFVWGTPISWSGKCCNLMRFFWIVERCWSWWEYSDDEVNKFCSKISKAFGHCRAGMDSIFTSDTNIGWQMLQFDAIFRSWTDASVDGNIMMLKWWTECAEEVRNDWLHGGWCNPSCLSISKLIAPTADTRANVEVSFAFALMAWN